MFKINLLEKRPNTTKKTGKVTKKQKTNSSKDDHSPNILRESNLPNKQEQDEILSFERERNKILRERLLLKKELLELGEI